MKVDRLSCHRFISNQFRLLLEAAAYRLMDALRRKLVCSGVRRMQLDSLRLDLIKIGGRVRGNCSQGSAYTWPQGIQDKTYGTPFR
jgi:hypothetical protein